MPMTRVFSPGSVANLGFSDYSSRSETASPVLLYECLPYHHPDRLPQSPTDTVIISRHLLWVLSIRSTKSLDAYLKMFVHIQSKSNFWNTAFNLLVLIFILFMWRNDYCYWLVDVGAGNYLNISILITDDEYGTNPGGLTIYDGNLFPSFVLRGVKMYIWRTSCYQFVFSFPTGNSNSAAVLGTISDKSQTESGSVVLGTSQQYAFFVYNRRSVSQYRGFLLSFNRVGKF